ncbi:MAG: site-specific DNA-methyltransferase, partial [Phycisphaerae bacterium]|nr:site-specific DNA-methyltransferase [Phycisphaerae bacterium]
MADRLSRAHRATSEFLLDFLYEAQVKEVCELTGLDPTGRRKTLVKKLLAAEDGPAKAHGQTRSGARARDHKAQPSRTPNMTEKDAKAADVNEQPTPLPEPPPGTMRVDKMELVWPGKYDEDGNLREPPRANLPFQVIERVNESRATREARKTTGGTLFDMYHAEEGPTFEAGWRNKLIWGDNLLVMNSLLEKFAGKIDLIYIDPPFEVGADFTYSTLVGDGHLKVVKEQSVLEEKAYRDTWGQGTESYLSMIYPRLAIARDLLAATGSIFVHCDWRLQSQLRVILDELLGAGCFRNEIVWKKNSLGAKGSATQFPRNQDVILFYSRSSTGYIFQRQYRGIREPIIRDRAGREKYPF